MTPEAQAERDAIVAWLLDGAKTLFAKRDHECNIAGEELESAAYLIRRGEHLQTPPQ